MADVFDLVAKITLDSKEYEKSLKNAEKNTSSFGSKIKTAVGTGAKVFAGFTAAGTAVAAATYKLATGAAEAADRVDKMSQKIGVSRTTFQELDFVLSQSGASIESMQAGMKTLRSAMDGARDGTKKNVEQFAQLGVAVTNADGSLRNQEDVMWDTIAALQGMDNETEKAKLATELFGKSGTELLPLLNSEAGSVDELRQKAHDLGLVMGDEAVDAGVKLTDSIDQAKRALSAIGNELGVAVMPVVQEAMDFIIDNMPTIREVVGTAFGFIREAIGTVVQVLGAVLIPAFEAMKSFVLDTLAPAISNAWNNIILPAFTTAFEFISSLWEGTLKPVLEAIWSYVTGTLASGLSYAWNEVIVPVFTAAFEAIQTLWNETLMPVFQGIYNFMTEKVIPVLKDKWESDILPTIQTVMETIKTIWETVLRPAIEAFYKFVSETLAPAIKDAFENIIQPVVETVFGAIATVWENVLSPALTALRDFLTNDLVPAAQGLGDKFTELKDEYLKPVATFLSGVFKGAFEGVKNFWVNTLMPKLEVLHEKLKEFKTEILDKINDFIRKQFIKAFEKVQDIWESVKEKLKPLKTALSQFKTKYLDVVAKAVEKGLQMAFQGLVDFWEGTLQPAIETLGGVVSDLWDNYLSPVAEYVTDSFGTAFETVQSILGELINFITGVFTGNWSSAWDGITSIFGAAFDGMIELAKTPINAVIGLINGAIGGVEAALNAVISGLNSIHVTIPDWVPLFGGDRFGISIPHVSWGRINYLAKGGILGEGGRAIVGENGMEYLSVVNGKAIVSPVGGRKPDSEMGGNKTQNFTFNIYAQPGQSEEQIAKSVQKQFVMWENQRKAAYV